VTSGVLLFGLLGLIFLAPINIVTVVMEAVGNDKGMAIYI